MFGYVKPVRCKLDEFVWEQYRAAYCGLCHTLGKRFGFCSRFIVNYDFTFLSVFLFSLESQKTCMDTTCKRCIASPFRKKCVCVTCGAFERAADASVILFWWKLKDAIADKSFFEGLPYRAICVLFCAAYRKADHNLPGFSRVVSECISELQTLEKQKVDSIDRPADTFARILAALSELCPQESRTDAEEMLYHLGRFVYLVDAWDDLKSDLKHGRYNPIAERFSVSDAKIPETVRTELEQTLCHSIYSAEIALGKLNCVTLRPLLENIMNPGLFSVMRQVADEKAPQKE